MFHFENTAIWTFIEKGSSRCFCWTPAAILADQNGTPMWRLHTQLYKGAWNVSTNNSETVGHKDLRLGQIVYMLVFYKISFSWLLPLDGFQFIFLLSDIENDLFENDRFKCCLLLFVFLYTLSMALEKGINVLLSMSVQKNGLSFPYVIRDSRPSTC